MPSAVPAATAGISVPLSRIWRAVQALRTGETQSLAGVAGKVDVQSVVEALAAAEMTMRTVVAVRDKVVEAYHDILRMPI